MHAPRKLLVMALAGCFLAVVSLRADVIHLKDGTQIEGDVRKADGGWRVTIPGGASQFLPGEKVASIELKSKTPGPDAADSRLASLRRAVEHLDSIPAVLKRYEQFIDQNKNTPAVADAKADIALWQQRQSAGMVKYGSQWVTPAERDELAAKAYEVTGDARQLIKQGRLKEADALLVKVLAADAKNVSALYLKGTIALRQDQLPAARKSFEATDALAPNHAPTLNNLGVILWRQNQFVASINAYNQAMIASPGDQRILNNVAEALHALSPKDQSAAVVKRASSRFQSQDHDLAQKLAASGWYRWGATWVTAAQLEQLKEAEKQIKTKLDALAGDFQSVQSKIAEIDSSIDSNNRALRNIEASSYVQDAMGNIFRIGYPQVYFDIQRDTTGLQNKRLLEVRKLDQLRKQAAVIQQQLPVPRYTGIQRPIGVEGTPLGKGLLASHTEPDAIPTTQPAPPPHTATNPTDAPSATTGPTTQPASHLRPLRPPRRANAGELLNVCPSPPSPVRSGECLPESSSEHCV